MAQSKEEKNQKARERRAAKSELQRRTAEAEAAENTIAQAAEVPPESAEAEVQEAKESARKRFPKPTNTEEYLARIADGKAEAIRSLDEGLPSEERLDAAVRSRHAWQQCINFAAFNVRDPLMEEMEARNTR